MTVEEFWEFGNRPENAGRLLDLINGRVVEWPRPYRPRGVVCATAGFVLGLYADRLQMGFATLGNAGVILSREPAVVVGPDVAFFARNEKEDALTGWSVHPPVLVVEVWSANYDRAQVVAKVEACLTNGVKVVWQVDYEERNVTVHRPNRSMEVVKEDGELTGADDMPGLTIKVADLFTLPGERTAPPIQPPAA